MGNNDSLPPPPPPGPLPEPPPTQVTPVPPPPPPPGMGAADPSARPPAPPAVPQFPDTAATTQMPSTQAYPVAAPAGAGTPPPGPPPTDAPEENGGNNKLPWIIAGAVTVVAVIVAAIVLLTGDDNTSSSPTTVSTLEPSTTVLETTTVAPPTTLVISSPSTGTPTTTGAQVPTTPAPGLTVLTDDTNTFTVLMLDTFETDTTPIDQDGVQIANVTGATDVAAFSRDDDHDTFGISVSAGATDQMPSTDELLASADPGGACSERTTESGYPTLIGNAEVVLLDGCGTEGQSAKVVMVLVFPDRNLTLAVYAQGAGPSNTDLLDFTQAVVESVVFL